MDEQPFFRVVARINSLLLLLILVGGLGFFAISAFQSSMRQAPNVIAVGESGPESDEEAPRLRVGRINNVPGHSVQYVRLATERQGGKFSGYSGGETRNVLFLRPEPANAGWLLDSHSYLVRDFQSISQSDQYDRSETVHAFFVHFATKDTNGDGSISHADQSDVALASPDGAVLAVIEEAVATVIDARVTPDQGAVTVLFQRMGKVVLGKYSLPEFNRISAQDVANLALQP